MPQEFKEGEFAECAICRDTGFKPDSPRLCPSCQHNRDLISSQKENLPQFDIPKLGSIVLVGPKRGVPSDSIRGTITGIEITDGPSVRYHVSWWDGRTRHHEWLAEFEVFQDESPPERVVIGFLRGSR